MPLNKDNGAPENNESAIAFWAPLIILIVILIIIMSVVFWCIDNCYVFSF